MQASNPKSDTLPFDPLSIRNTPDTEVALTVDHYFGNGDTFKKL